MFFKKIGTFFLDILCPPACPICNNRVEAAHCLCPECYRKLNFITSPCCEVCGRPFEYKGLGQLVCGSCLNQKPKFTMARSILAYDDFSKKLILAFKHGDRTELVSLFGKFLSLTEPKIFENIDIIVPVPLHWRRRFQRQYNQAGLLGMELSRLKKIPYNPTLMKRIRYTESQGHKHKKEREKNIKKAFKVTKPAEIRGKTILLIDDVMTTGATLNECAKMLSEAGAKQIKVLTLYRVITL